VKSGGDIAETRVAASFFQPVAEPKRIIRMKKLSLDLKQQLKQ
jgi:hypothetical protein